MRNLAVLVSTAALLAAGASNAAPVAETTATAVSSGEPVMAVWVEKKVDFPYKGLTAYYSCDGIRLKVTSILKMIGAREGFKVDVRMCPNYPRPENMPWVYILVARVKGQDSPVAEPTAQFPARWEKVVFRGSPVGPIQQGDCELVDEMAQMVFVQLGARIVENTTACVPKQVNPGSVRLTLEVLKPVPEP